MVSLFCQTKAIKAKGKVKLLNVWKMILEIAFTRIKINCMAWTNFVTLGLDAIHITFV